MSRTFCPYLAASSLLFVARQSAISSMLFLILAPICFILALFMSLPVAGQPQRCLPYMWLGILLYKLVGGCKLPEIVWVKYLRYHDKNRKKGPTPLFPPPLRGLLFFTSFYEAVLLFPLHV